MIRAAVLVRSRDEARDLVAHIWGGRLDPSRCVIVGLEPSARATLERAGVATVDTLAFFDNASHARSLRATQGMRERVQAAFHLDLDDGMDAVYQHQFATMVLYGYRHCISTIEILHGIRAQYPQCDTIVCCESPGADALQHVYRVFCEVHGLSFELLPAPRAQASARPPSDAAASELPAWAAGWITRCYAVIARGLARRGPVIAYTGGKMASLIRSLIERYPQCGTVYLRYFSYGLGQELVRTIVWLASLLWGGRLGSSYLSVPIHTIGGWVGRKDRERTGRRIEASLDAFYERNGPLFRYRSIDCKGAVQVNAGHAQSRLRQYHDVGLGMAHLLSRLRPSLVISASGGQEHQVIGELARSMGIQSLFISMKSVSDPEGELERMGAQAIIEDVVSEFYSVGAAQSEQAWSYMRRMGYPKQLIRSGPLLRTRIGVARRDEMRAKLRGRGQAERVILYAPSMKSSVAFYSIQTLDEVVASMADLVQAVERLPGALLILRLHPGYADLAQDLPHLLDLGSHTVIDTGTYDSIEDVLSVADLVVSNMSTVAEEAVCNGIPVVLYDRWARYNHLQAPVVDGPYPDALSPVYYLPDQAHLVSTLAWVLASHPVGSPFTEAVTDKYVFSDGRNQEFYEYVGQALGASPQQSARVPLTGGE